LMVKLREGAAFLPGNVPDQGAAFLRRSARSGSLARISGFVFRLPAATLKWPPESASTPA
jgi:hypothetical protein